MKSGFSLNTIVLGLNVLIFSFLSPMVPSFGKIHSYTYGNKKRRNQQMIEPKIALFLTLDGKAQEAIQFYQETLDATLLFAITNQEYRERLDPSLEIFAGQEQYLSHSILQIGDFQLQLADNPLVEGEAIQLGNHLSLSLTIDDTKIAQKLYQRLMENGSQMIQAPSDNPFAFFYASVRDPFGVIIQLTVEKEVDPSKKGE